MVFRKNSRHWGRVARVSQRKKGFYHQDDLKITKRMITGQCRKLLNWVIPGPDGVQGYWLENLPLLHERFGQQMDQMIDIIEVTPSLDNKA